MIIIDENVEQYWIDLLTNKGYPVLSIKKEFPQLPNRAIIEIAKQHNGLLITEDKDFGELVFSYGLSGMSVIFLRYDQPQYQLIEKQLLETIVKYHECEDHFFVTVKKDNTRVRKI